MSGVIGVSAPARLAVLGWLVLSVQFAWAAPPPIYTCVDANGKKLTSDRPIPECNAREQRVLNADGSVKVVVPPNPTADERAEIEARQREAVAEQAARQDALRRDRNLMARFPNEAAHRKAREAALGDMGKAVKASEARMALLAAERKPLLDEAEFYLSTPMPGKLKQQLDANDAAVEAQRTLVQDQQSEVVRINALYDAEFERLKKLWGGARPGSLGGLPEVTASPASAVRKAAAK